MDIYCPRCSEPWDTDELHYVEDAETGKKLTYEQAKNLFRKVGCAAFEGEKAPTCGKSNDLKAEASATLLDLLGDDIDGVASLLEDFDAVGMLE